MEKLTSNTQIVKNACVITSVGTLEIDGKIYEAAVVFDAVDGLDDIDPDTIVDLSKRLGDRYSSL